MTVCAVLQVAEPLLLMLPLDLRTVMFVAAETGVGVEGIWMAGLASCLASTTVIEGEGMMLQARGHPGVRRVAGTTVGAELGAVHLRFVVAGHAVRWQLAVLPVDVAHVTL